MKEFKNWGKEYKIEFAIKVDKLPTANWTNVFHFIAHDNIIGQYGDHIPAVYIHKSGYFRVSSAVNKDYNFKLGKKYQATIQQFKKQGKYWYEIITDGESYKIENEKPKNFENVKLYASDPWYAPFSSDIGMIQNVKITVPSNDVSGRFFFIIIEQFFKMIFDN